MDELEKLGIDDKFGVIYDNEEMQKRMINTARNWGYDDGKAEGLEEGKKEGKKEEKVFIAKNLLNIGISIEVISESTGVSIKEVEELKKEA